MLCIYDCTVYSLDSINEIFDKYNIWVNISKQYKNQIMTCKRKLPFSLYYKAYSLIDNLSDKNDLMSLYQLYLFEYDKLVFAKKINNILS